TVLECEAERRGDGAEGVEGCGCLALRVECAASVEERWCVHEVDTDLCPRVGVEWNVDGMKGDAGGGAVEREVAEDPVLLVCVCGSCVQREILRARLADREKVGIRGQGKGSAGKQVHPAV